MSACRHSFRCLLNESPADCANDCRPLHHPENTKCPELPSFPPHPVLQIPVRLQLVQLFVPLDPFSHSWCSEYLPFCLPSLLPFLLPLILSINLRISPLIEANIKWGGYCMSQMKVPGSAQRMPASLCALDALPL